MINYKQYLIYRQIRDLIAEFDNSFVGDPKTVTTYDVHTNAVIDGKTMPQDELATYLDTLDSSKVNYVVTCAYELLVNINIIRYISDNFDIPMDTLRKRLTSFKITDAPYLLSPAQFYYLQTGSYSVPTTPEWTA